MLAPSLAYWEQISLPVAGLCIVIFFPVTFSPTCPLFLFSCHFIHTATQMNCYLFLVSFFPTCPLLLSFLLLCFLSETVNFVPDTLFPTWNCYVLSCFFFPICPLLLSFLLLFSCYFFSYLKLLLSFLLPFSCYFISVHHVEHTSSRYSTNIYMYSVPASRFALWW